MATITTAVRVQLVEEWVRRYRAQNPRSRVVCPYRIARNGGTKRVYESLVDGSRISMSARWPITRRVLTWMAAQDDAAAAQLIAWAEQDAA